ncbi:MAG: putative Type secretory pathway component PulD [Betaproteobacteria bacterium]|jgi:MSHA type pilus biogenesis protein MshL|nr:putative Type secretory pathway component PulD [Betaproteobacteria bacterium]
MRSRLASSTRREASYAIKPAGLTHLRVAVLVALLTGGCSQVRPYVPPSEGHIAAKAKPEVEQRIPAPARVSSFVPPPQPTIKPQTYSVVVNEVPVKELLNALARDTRQNIDIHPGLQGLVSLNAIDETLPAILERIARQVNIRFRQEGNTIVVAPDTPYMKSYRVNYVNVTRNISSTLNVSGEVGSGAVVGGAGGAGGGGVGTGGSRTTVTSTTSNDFWEQLRDNIRAILISTARVAATAEDKAARAEEEKAAREEALRRADAVSRAGPGAADLLRSAFPQSLRPAASLQQTDTGTDVIINPISGTVSVLGTERQQQLIQQHLDNITSSVQRQVLIEATIVEVVLSDAYQGGVNWSRLAVSGGIAITQTLLGGFAGAASAAGAAAGNSLTVGYQNPRSDVGNISATIQLLQEFGNTRVLSSPKVMAINNQTALLKVVDNIVYFEVQAQQGLITSSGTQTPPTFTSTPRTVAVGVVMGVTPQINEDGRVTLTVRPTISRLLRFTNDPNPSLCNEARTNCVANPVPEVQVREMESVLQIATGQTVILGGLMQDEASFNREQIPIVGNVKDVGELFRFRNERVRKTELVIFLRPIVITNPSLDSDELKFFQRFLPQVGGAATRTGTAP